MLIFDLETNGLLRHVSKIWTVGVYDTVTDQYTVYSQDRVEEGLRIISGASCLIGHNIIDYDLPVIQKLYPQYYPHGAEVIDTLVYARLSFPNIKRTDYGRHEAGRLPGELIGSHSLEAWGYRLDILKGTYGKQDGAWDAWTPEMDTYCLQDVHVTRALLTKCQATDVPQDALQLELKVQDIIMRQCRRGVVFNTKKAEGLYLELIERRDSLEQALRGIFPVRILRDGKDDFIPKSDSKRFGYVKGCPVTKIKYLEFSPGSRDQIKYWLVTKYGWEPEEFTDAGQPKIDDEVMGKLAKEGMVECGPLSEYLMVTKRISQLAEGKEAWLKAVTEEGRIYGYVNTLGTGTRRMSHSKPNLAQVPKVGSEYGKECRELFGPTPGYVLVGCDAASLELRCLSHFMAPFDGGAYGRASIDGKKEDKTDVHSVNQKAVGLDTRDDAKTWFYAYIYGAGDKKLGKIQLKDKPGDPTKVGSSSRKRFKKNLPAIGTLTDLVQSRLKDRGYLKGLDGCRVFVPSEHAALNYVLQGAGAIIMKRALVILEASLQASGLKHSEQSPNHDYEFLMNVHDEFQIEVKPEHVETVKKLAQESIRLAGDYYKFRCPLAGEADSGANWADTH